MNEIKKFVKERDAVLLTRDINKLKEFIANCKYYDKKIKESFLKMPDKFIEVTMHKMIINDENLPTEFRQYSYDWLANRQ